MAEEEHDLREREAAGEASDADRRRLDELGVQLDAAVGSLSTGAMQAGPNREPAPYGSYALITGAFLGSLAGTAALERALHREARATTPFGFAVLCAATFKAARAVSRERVGSVIREPFVETEDATTDAVERPAGHGLRLAIGELVTCTRCAGTWAAAGLLTTQVAAPRIGRLLTLTLAAGAANDFLQAAFAALCDRKRGAS